MELCLQNLNVNLVQVKLKLSFVKTNLADVKFELKIMNLML